MRKRLKEYAELAIKIGVNVQKDQIVSISAPIHSIEFVRELSKVAYERGAREVVYNWSDDQLTLMKFQKATDKAFEKFPKWEADRLNYLADEGACFLNVISPDPELLKDVDVKRVANWSKVRSEAVKEYYEKVLSDKNSWSIVALPCEAWATKVFPEVSNEEAMDKLMEMILDICRIDGKAISNWEQHNKNLTEKVKILNEKKFTAFHYKSEGTDLMVGMSKKQVWKAGEAVTTDGIVFNPNLPTEEVFSLPDKNKVDGILASKLPLNYNGNIIDNFTLTFEKGKVVKFTAEKGYEVLEGLLNTDDGARYLGEIALVPVDSPISNTNTLFYNTLFDENASCHFAFGAAYKNCIEGSEKMTKEELEAEGVNDSLVHVDFMVGSKDLSIDGIEENGDRTPIFRNGNWVI